MAKYMCAQKLTLWIVTAFLFCASNGFARQVEISDRNFVPQQFAGVKTIKLPAEVTEVKTGANGRYIFYFFKSLKNIGMFDVFKDHGQHELLRKLLTIEFESYTMRDGDVIFNVEKGSKLRFRKIKSIWYLMD